jgi:thermitase
VLGRVLLALLVVSVVALAPKQLDPPLGRVAMILRANQDGGVPDGLPSIATTAGVVPNDPWWSAEWGLARIGMPALWQHTLGDPSTVIAVVDTGVDAGEPDLAGAVLTGYDAVDGTSAVGDVAGHGTLVAEVAAGRGDNDVGGAGICWRCSILPVKVAADDTASASQLAAGIRWATDHGADVINVSLVLSAPDPGVAAAVQYAEDHGAIVVAAAGNDGGTSPTYPAAYPGVLGVVATDERDRPYDWSTHGAWAAFAAPGCATAGDGSGAETSFCGSSAAAPVVSGLVGLLWSEGMHSPSDIHSALAAAAAPVDRSIAAGGRVDAARLAARLASPELTTP